jgi:Family of unknown function (DUF6364)
MSKLTLNVSSPVVSRAKRYAKQRGTSVSKLVESYLSAVAEPARDTAATPVLRAVRGSLKKARLESYTKHLAVKYR